MVPALHSLGQHIKVPVLGQGVPPPGAHVVSLCKLETTFPQDACLPSVGKIIAVHIHVGDIYNVNTGPAV